MLVYLMAIAGLVLLVMGGEFLVRSSVSLSFKMNLSRMVIGMTVVSFATSAPEMIVSVHAAMTGHSDLALSNVIGSNIANIALVLGVTALIIPLYIDREFFAMNWPVMIFLSLLLYFFLKNDGQLTGKEGVVLLVLLSIFIYVLIKRARKLHLKIPEEVDEKLKFTPWWKVTVWLIAGAASLWYGSELLIDSASQIARQFGVSESVIGISMVALGTSIPELSASIMAAIKKEHAISIGNLIGSNIFNIGSVLGVTSIIHPIHPEQHSLMHTDIFWMIGIAFILAPLALLPSKNRFYRWEGVLLIVLYFIFIFLKFNS